LGQAPKRAREREEARELEQIPEALMEDEHGDEAGNESEDRDLEEPHGLSFDSAEAGP
jgi:hypothetical protein